MHNKLTPRKKYNAYEFSIIRYDFDEKAVLQTIYANKEKDHSFRSDELNVKVPMLFSILSIIYIPSNNTNYILTKDNFPIEWK